MSMHVLLVGAHPRRGYALRRIGSLMARAWEEAGAEVDVVTAPDAVSSRLPWKSAGRRLATVETAAWAGQSLHRRAAKADLVVVVDARDAVWMSSLAGKVPVTVVAHSVSSTWAASEDEGHRPGAVARFKTPILAKGMQRADHVLCTSESAARAVRRLTEHAPTVLHLPVDPQVLDLRRRSAVRPGPAWPYLLTVDSGARPGSRDRIITAWANLRRTQALDGASLVVVGPPLDAEEENRVIGIGGHVEVFQDVDDTTLGALYENARAVLALSRGEGFSWQVAEAHAAGRPVLAADDAGYEETGADGCLYLPLEAIDALDAPSWVAVADDLTSPGLIARARANAERFAWSTFTARLPAASVAKRVAVAAAARPLTPPPAPTISAQPVSAQPTPADLFAAAFAEPSAADLPPLDRPGGRRVASESIDLTATAVPAQSSPLGTAPRRRLRVGG